MVGSLGVGTQSYRGSISIGSTSVIKGTVECLMGCVMIGMMGGYARGVALCVPIVYMGIVLFPSELSGWLKLE